MTSVRNISEVIVSAWLINSGQVKGPDSLQLSGYGYKQVAAVAKEHLQDQTFLAYFASNPFCTHQTVKGVVQALDPYGEEFDPVIFSAFGITWVDDLFPKRTERQLSVAQLLSSLQEEKGHPGLVTYEDIASLAPQRTRALANVFKTNILEAARLVAGLALCQRQKQAAFLAAVQSPLPESLMVGGRNKNLIHPGDIVCFKIKVPVVLSHPTPILASVEVFSDNLFPCPSID